MKIPFNIYNKNKINSLINFRKGETKFGESITYLEDREKLEALYKNESKFVLIGIPEDFGVRANFGLSGTQTTFEWVIKALLNTQQNSFFNPNQLLILGAFDFKAHYQYFKTASISELRKFTEEIDSAVHEVVSLILSNNKIPIIIGGGHNNAYPILKALSENQNQSINAINIDAHSDFRALEGRHSGNGFSYAKANKILDQYIIWGLHQNYTSEYQLKALNENNFKIHWIEDLFELNIQKQLELLLTSVNFISNKKFGFELDLDAIANVNSSANSPIGFSANEVMNYIKLISAKDNCAYFHICEGAYQIADGPKDSSIGKLISNYVLQFLKNYNKK